jgi:hypothetical protein
MCTNYKEVRRVIQALAMKISMTEVELNGQSIGNAIYGLQSMNSECEEVSDD